MIRFAIRGGSMPEWHCDPGVSIAGLTARSKWYKSEFVPFQLGGQYPGMGGQLAPEWGVRMVRNLHIIKV